MKKEILTVKHLQKTFDNHGKKFAAVKDVSLKIHQGEIVALIGPNGAGKTTTVSMVGGFLNPSSGQVKINGHDIWKSKHFDHSGIGVVFGGELGFYGRASAYDNLVFFANLNKIKWRQQRSEIQRVLKLVDLQNVANKQVWTFSRGMYQRLHIARALLGSPSLLLLDEPTNGLDVEIAKEIHGVLQKLVKNTGVAILLTSHIMSEVEALSDKIILIGDGKVKETGTVSEIIAKSSVHHIDRPATLEESYLAFAPELRREQ
ncbi:ABC transporter ATP-binding protein [Companilactobacillus alimentarius]|uniref:ABC transporter ATP-binding protein n=1 Tax=Companilactobacillus alimentarius DSM 20249 TaxID=1423720 RepID=A0A2K9HPK9_9LACO|nr:ABC transporter ATP-binding protein [Companilactobacillus alimentarius]AUI71322.1 ABC transporter ATP-binding protein [Companilactobacillus alimentarius DSM 20249]KRK74785.1 ABC transporter ATPase component [Companilactobacillus alimentarius DSM 20249]GEO44300.1 hypothetical protein LAL01_05320 [Companilactobacillus alimentarius]